MGKILAKVQSELYNLEGLSQSWHNKRENAFAYLNRITKDLKLKSRKCPSNGNLIILKFTF